MRRLALLLINSALALLLVANAHVDDPATRSTDQASAEQGQPVPDRPTTIRQPSPIVADLFRTPASTPQMKPAFADLIGVELIGVVLADLQRLRCGHSARAKPSSRARENWYGSEWLAGIRNSAKGARIGAR